METRSGQPVSRFSFGCMQFGGKASEADSAGLYDACREVGINFFDTAYAYTGGASETILGGLLADERDDIFLATKCGEKCVAAPDVIRAEFDESRRRLNQDSVDLLYLHKWDPDTPLEATYEVVAKWVQSGLVRYIGVSNYAAWQVMKAKRVAEDMDIQISFLQPMYNLVKRQAEVELLPMCESEGIHVCPYSPLGGGLLTGKYTSGGEGRLVDDSKYNTRYGQDWMHKTASDLIALSKDIGVPAPVLAVAWVANNPALWGPIISARSVEQVKPSLEAMSFEMDDDLYARLADLSPTPPPATDRLEEA